VRSQAGERATLIWLTAPKKENNKKTKNKKNGYWLLPDLNCLGEHLIGIYTVFFSTDRPLRCIALT